MERKIRTDMLAEEFLEKTKLLHGDVEPIEVLKDNCHYRGSYFMVKKHRRRQGMSELKALKRKLRPDDLFAGQDFVLHCTPAAKRKCPRFSGHSLNLTGKWRPRMKIIKS